MYHSHVLQHDFQFVYSCNVVMSRVSKVFVSSDKRPCRNLTFHNVLARQGSFCNRERLNFQAFELRGVKMAA